MGELDLTGESDADILELLVVSDELLLEELFKHVQDYLIEKQSAWVQQNLFLILHTVFKLSNCKELQDYCLDFICIEPLSFISSKDFLSLGKDILYELLKRDDLQIKEVVAWDYLIKWGINQTPGLVCLNNNRATWDDRNYAALKKTLNQFIPLIRFSDISSVDFFDKVRPYKPIIPQKFYEELMKFYMRKSSSITTTLPPRICSLIIRSKLISIILNWIEGRSANIIRTKQDSLYRFDLLFRG